jgi:lipopolysaccharide biosynthesis regulator YciM
VLKLKPTHSSAPKELAKLAELQAAVEELEKIAEQAGQQQINQAAANELLQKVYKTAPDCIPAQLLEAKLEMAQGNHEQVSLVVVAGWQQ